MKGTPVQKTVPKLDHCGYKIPPQNIHPYHHFSRESQVLKVFQDIFFDRYHFRYKLPIEWSKRECRVVKVVRTRKSFQILDYFPLLLGGLAMFGGWLGAAAVYEGFPGKRLDTLTRLRLQGCIAIAIMGMYLMAEHFLIFVKYGDELYNGINMLLQLYKEQVARDYNHVMRLVLAVVRPGQSQGCSAGIFILAVFSIFLKYVLIVTLRTGGPFYVLRFLTWGTISVDATLFQALNVGGGFGTGVAVLLAKLKETASFVAKDKAELKLFRKEFAAVQVTGMPFAIGQFTLCYTSPAVTVAIAGFILDQTVNLIVSV
ncbi:hypothetical protein Fcan01_17485 [Folsomia candida]|uniref:Uncharacterized protein n=1 Tax=Folsomia candida TaxID=158441 RepID=A0A226DT68_FOLCA|nr:hypothetical protein Fcan01_17485 [Folsomia candida]